jgi:hypothetical protein
LAANPLLLTMIANVHRYRGQLPNGRTALYGEMCDVLIHRRQEAKGLADKDELTGEQKEHIIRVLALEMMERRIRDIPVTEAEVIVGDTVRQVSRATRPSTFMEEVRKSGLLTEREQGVYSFAHLTLQEYLAATQIRELRKEDLLIAAVDDPWWREVTLLWASRANATSVITACLESGTVRALSLAFDCADEARQIDPSVRRQLDEILVTQGAEGTVDDNRRRLITAVLAARALRDLMWLDAGNAVCARPVPGFLFALFVREEQFLGLNTPSVGFSEISDDDPPAVGMWANDALRFVSWLNRLFDDGSAYRLPTNEELSDPAMGLISDFTRRSVWLQTTSGLALRHPNGVAPSNAVSMEILRRYVQADRLVTSEFLGLAQKLSEAGRPSQVLIESKMFFQVFDDEANLEEVNLQRSVRDLLIARSINYAAMRTGSLLRTDIDFGVAIGKSIGRLQRSTGMFLGSHQGGFRDTAEVIDNKLFETIEALSARIHYDSSDYITPSPSFENLSAIFDENAELTMAPSVAAGLDSYMTWELDSLQLRARALNRSLDANLELSTDLQNVRTRARENAFRIRSELGPLRRSTRRLQSLFTAQAIDLNNNLDLDLDIDFSTKRGRYYDLVFLSALNFGRAQDIHRNCDVDLAVDLALASFLRGAPAVISAYGILLRSWALTRKKKKKRSGDAIFSFDNYLVSILTNSIVSPVLVSADPISTLKAADSALTERRGSITSSHRTNRQNARFLVKATASLLEPVIKRETPWDPGVMASGRVNLLAALSLLYHPRDEEGIKLLTQALSGLVALDERIYRHTLPNEILLLVRN